MSPASRPGRENSQILRFLWEFRHLIAESLRPVRSGEAPGLSPFYRADSSLSLSRPGEGTGNGQGKYHLMHNFHKIIFYSNHKFPCWLVVSDNQEIMLFFFKQCTFWSLGCCKRLFLFCKLILQNEKPLKTGGRHRNRMLPLGGVCSVTALAQKLSQEFNP